jgi:hypothetical protein
MKITFLERTIDLNDESENVLNSIRFGCEFDSPEIDETGGQANRLFQPKLRHFKA